MRILFVCRANIGRSQMGEAIFNKLTDGKYEVISAGTQVLDEEVQKLKDIPIASDVLTVLKEIDIDASDNIRIQLTPELVNKVDLILNMAGTGHSPEYLLESGKTLQWDIRDSLEHTLEFTRGTRDQITERVKELIEQISP